MVLYYFVFRVCCRLIFFSISRKICSKMSVYCARIYFVIGHLQTPKSLILMLLLLSFMLCFCFFFFFSLILFVFYIKIP